MRLLLRLYPAAWRARYCDELDTLLRDARTGWRGDLDVFKGAVDMRLKYQSGMGIVLGFVVAGILAGLLASYSVPEQWQVKAALQIYFDATHTDPTDRIEDLRSELTSRQTLCSLIAANDLYHRERRTDPLEAIADTMRSNLRISVAPVPVDEAVHTFTIAFSYPDAKKAEDVVNAIISRIIALGESGPDHGYLTDVLNLPSQGLPSQGHDTNAIVARLVQADAADRRLGGYVSDRGYRIEVLDHPHGPQRPIWPNRAVFMATGAVGGLILALAALLIRRRMQPPGPGLQAA